jgi:hypothetical protein
VNVPSVSREVLEQLGPWLDLAHKMGTLAGQLAPEAVTAVEVQVGGEAGEHPLKPLTVQVLKGLLTQLWGESVNEVSAPALARERGIEILEQRKAVHEDYSSALTVKVKGKTELTVEGTVFGKRDPRIVRLNEFQIEAVPAGHLIAIHNQDVPGVLGRIGTTLGEAGVNIGRIHLSRTAAQRDAFSLINVDNEPTASLMDKIRGISGVTQARHIRL